MRRKYNVLQYDITSLLHVVCFLLHNAFTMVKSRTLGNNKGNPEQHAPGRTIIGPGLETSVAQTGRAKEFRPEHSQLLCWYS